MKQISLSLCLLLIGCTVDENTIRALHDPTGLKAAKQRYMAKQAELGRLEADEEYRKKQEAQQQAQQGQQGQ